jgi:eight-cysteine-cluster-containing protein
MAMPNGKCVDGSMSGPTGQCVRAADGRCGWEIRQCPTPTACVRTGCSGTVCAEPGNDIMTTCEMRPEYECYASAKCQRQSNGACAWTASAALSQCLTAATGKQ